MKRLEVSAPQRGPEKRTRTSGKIAVFEPGARTEADLVENFANFQPYALAFREKSKFFAYFCAGAQKWALSGLTWLRSNCSSLGV